MINAVLFDLDDTLHDKKKGLELCAAFLHKSFLAEEVPKRIFVDEFVAQNCVVQTKTEAFSKLSENLGFNRDTCDKLLEVFDSHFHDFAISYPGALACLKALRLAGYRLGIVTNGRDFFQRNKIRALGFEPYMDCIVTSEACYVKKPEKRIFEVALKTLRVEPASTIFCGDSLQADMEPAKNLGMKTLWKVEYLSQQPPSVDYQFLAYESFATILSNMEGRKGNERA